MIVHKLVLNQNHKMSCHIKVSFMFFVVCILFQAKAKDPDARPRPHYAPLLSTAVLVLIYFRSVFHEMGSRAHCSGFTT